MKERIPFVDYIRVAACFLVMLVHASENFYGSDTGAGLASNVSMLLNEQNRRQMVFGIGNHTHADGDSGCRAWLFLPDDYEYTLKQTQQPIKT